MIEFASEMTRTQFHLTPLTFQKEMEGFSARLLVDGYAIKIYYVNSETLEASIRIDKKFDVSAT